MAAPCGSIFEGGNLGAHGRLTRLDIDVPVLVVDFIHRHAVADEPVDVSLDFVERADDRGPGEDAGEDNAGTDALHVLGSGRGDGDVMVVDFDILAVRVVGRRVAHDREDVFIPVGIFKNALGEGGALGTRSLSVLVHESGFKWDSVDSAA